MGLKLWQEVEDVNGTVGGLIYEKSETNVKFRDEHGINYNLSIESVKPANYMSYSEKEKIAMQFRHFNWRTDRIN